MTERILAPLRSDLAILHSCEMCVRKTKRSIVLQRPSENYLNFADSRDIPDCISYISRAL